MIKGSLTIGRLFGTALRVHWSAAVIAAVLGSMLARDLGTTVAFVGIGSFFVAIIVHELAHALVARRFGIGTTSIELWGLGGLARLEREPSSPRAEGWIAAAGPLVNLLIGGLAALATWASRANGGAWALSVSLLWFAVVNLGLAAFNILPGSPLDGGKVLRAVRWSRHGDRFRAMREAASIGTILGGGLTAFGIGMSLSGRPGLWLLVSGAFMLLSARADIVAAALGERVGPAKVAELTWFGVAEVASEATVNEMLWQHGPVGGAGVVAVRGRGGALEGVVFEEQIWSLSAVQRTATRVRSLMTPIERLSRADVADDLAIPLIGVNPLRPVITVWRHGSLLGVVPPNVIRAKLEQLLAADLA